MEQRGSVEGCVEEVIILDYNKLGSLWDACFTSWGALGELMCRRMDSHSPDVTRHAFHGTAYCAISRRLAITPGADTFSDSRLPFSPQAPVRVTNGHPGAHPRCLHTGNSFLLFAPGVVDQSRLLFCVQQMLLLQVSRGECLCCE